MPGQRRSRFASGTGSARRRFTAGRGGLSGENRQTDLPVIEAKSLLSSLILRRGRFDKSMNPLPEPLPWAAIAGPWAHAEDSLARLDQTLAMRRLIAR